MVLCYKLPAASASQADRTLPCAIGLTELLKIAITADCKDEEYDSLCIMHDGYEICNVAGVQLKISAAPVENST